MKKFLFLINLITVSASFAYDESIGQNQRGDFIFQNASILRNKTSEMEDFKNNPRMGSFVSVSNLSGNFVILSRFIDFKSLVQIFDTVTGRRYNLRDCNGPRMVAISDTKALVNDCSQEVLLDMTTGERSKTNPMFLFRQAIAMEGGGAVVMDLDDLKWVDTTGQAHTIAKDLKPGLELVHAITNKNNKRLAILKDSNQVYVLDIDTGKRSDVLFGSRKNVFKTRIDSDGGLLTLVHFSEDDLGNPVLGTYDLNLHHL